MKTAIAEVTAVLSADCNLRCSYCYQDRKRPGAMAWASLRAALDLLLASPCRPRALSFAGGEPTLEFPLIRRAVRHLSQRSPDEPVRLHLVTNGLLLGPRELAFLARHAFDLDLSFDGVEGAQNLRQPGSFARLDRLLKTLGTRHQAYFNQRVSVAITISREAIGSLADSFDYLRRRGVRRVAIQPAIGRVEWSPEDLTAFDAQMSRIVQLSLEHGMASGDVPFLAFARTARSASAGARRTWGCTAPLGRTLAVDVDGQVYPCALLARSYQVFAPSVEQRMRPLSLGHVGDRRLPERLAALGVACRAAGLFDPKRMQHSGDRRCATCPERASCVICPVARTRGAAAGELTDVNDIPRYLCAYQRILGRHRRRFLARTPRWRGEELAVRILRRLRKAAAE